MLYRFLNDGLEKFSFEDFGSINRKEKELENIFARNLKLIYGEQEQLFPIFQERAWQEEPDLCALDEQGNLIIFEFKRSSAYESTTNQIMRYTEQYGRLQYAGLNELYQKYINKKSLLIDDHAEVFGLEKPLRPDAFNRKQKLRIVGSSMESGLAETVDYWKKQGVDIDFIPYRLFFIDGNYYLEYFAKPYDRINNIRNVKGILFDTNRTYDENAIWDMLKGGKISAYGEESRFVDWFNKGDYVFFYHKQYGVVVAGCICDSTSQDIPEKRERYRKVKFLSSIPQTNEELRGIRPYELKCLLGKGFYYASTVK